MIRLKKSIKRADLERLIDNLGGLASESISLPLAFNTSSGFGLTPLVIQLLATWSRKQSNPTLRMFSENTTEYMLAFASTPHGAAAIYFAQFVEFNDKTTVRAASMRKYIVPTLLAMQAMEFRKTIRGPGVQFASYASSANEWIRPMYPDGSESSYRPSHLFSDLLLKAVTSFNRRAVNNIQVEDFAYIGSILFELFQNTHQHARRNLKGELFQKSVRAIYIRYFPFEETVDSNLSELDIAIRRFITTSILAKGGRQPTRKENIERYENLISQGSEVSQARHSRTDFLEICVYDTGVGLVENWKSTRKPLTTLTEVELINECFKVGASSKKTPNSGMGLPNAIRSLNLLGAFLLLRTHRQCLYQDFTRRDTESFSPKSIKPGNGSELSLIEGTSFTLVVPI
jgi:hypothetical protein